MQEQEKLFADILKLEGKLKKSIRYLIVAFIAKIILTIILKGVLLPILLYGQPEKVSLNFFEELSTFALFFCLAYFIGIFFDLSYKFVRNYVVVLIGMLLTPVVIVLLFLFLILYMLVVGIFMLLFPVVYINIAIGAALIFYDAYKILSRPVYKKKLTAMKEQYAQSMLQIEYE
jgi:hypothetical protein